MVKSRRSLKDWMKNYYPEAEKIQLVYGQHLINIDTTVEGSAGVIRSISKDALFEFIQYEPEFKYLRLVFVISVLRNWS